MKLIGIDYGTKRVGIAISDDEGNLAFPKCVLENNTALLENITRIITDEHITTVVLGYSLDYKGADNSVMKAITVFKDELEKQSALRVFLEPEFLTSAEAKRQPSLLKQPRSRKKRSRKSVDAEAAALILQSYLDKQHPSIK